MRVPGRAPDRAFLAMVALAAIASAGGCSRSARHALPPGAVPHAAWESQPRLGHAADAYRRNLRPGDSLRFRDLTITALGTRVDSGSSRPGDLVHLRLRRADDREDRWVREGGAFNWSGYHVAVVAVYGPGELGAGLSAIEVATISSLPREHLAIGQRGGSRAAAARATPDHPGDAAPHWERGAPASRRGSGGEAAGAAILGRVRAQLVGRAVPFPARPGRPRQRGTRLAVHGGDQHHVRPCRAFPHQRDRQLRAPGTHPGAARVHRRPHGVGRRAVPAHARQHRWALSVRPDLVSGAAPAEIPGGRDVSQDGLATAGPQRPSHPPTVITAILGYGSAARVSRPSRAFFCRTYHSASRSSAWASNTTPSLMVHRTPPCLGSSAAGMVP